MDLAARSIEAMKKIAQLRQQVEEESDEEEEVRISVVVWLLCLSGRALAVQARGVLGSTPGDCWPFHFLLQHLATMTCCFLPLLSTL